MDAATLALAKNYTNSQRLAYTETNVLTFDGNAEENSLMEGIAKISDTPMDLSTINRIVVMNEGEPMEFTKDMLSIGESDLGQTANMGDAQLVISVTTASGVLPVGVYVVAYEELFVSRIEFAETIHPIDPKFIPALDSVTLNSPGGKKFAVTVDDTGALVATEVST